MIFSIGVRLTASLDQPGRPFYGYDRSAIRPPVHIGDTIRTRVTIAAKEDDPKRTRAGRVIEPVRGHQPARRGRSCRGSHLIVERKLEGTTNDSEPCRKGSSSSQLRRQGIGRPTALAFAKAGAKVHATDINADAVGSLERRGGHQHHRLGRPRHACGRSAGRRNRGGGRALQLRRFRACRFGADDEGRGTSISPSTSTSSR